jgi:hypothetical protein
MKSATSRSAPTLWFVRRVSSDLLVSRLQTEHLKQSSSFDDLKAELLDQVGDLRVNLSQVKAVSPLPVPAANYTNAPR